MRYTKDELIRLLKNVKPSKQQIQEARNFVRTRRGVSPEIFQARGRAGEIKGRAVPAEEARDISIREGRVGRRGVSDINQTAFSEIISEGGVVIQ